MAMVSVRLNDELNEELDNMVQEGLFKDKTDAFHEAIRLLMLRYDGFTLSHTSH
jgi:Arc/MetJ-type ribon-helix-helix transcriptional regulator